MNFGRAVLALCAFSLSASARNAPCSSVGKPIIIDTDIFSDVDDVGSLTVANALHNYGLADLRGVAINTGSKYGALAVSSLNTYFGNGDIPIAALRPLTNESFFDTRVYTLGEYASKLGYHWPRSLNDSSTTPTPVEFYRTELAAAEDHSMTVISIGFLTNLAALLDSPADEISALAGPALVSAKMKELVVMGGRYPSGWEFNFGGRDPASTYRVINNWPRDVPVTYSGGELGGDIYSGQDLAKNALPDSPVLAAYQWYVGRCSTIRESWDPVTTLYGILGIEGLSELGIEKMFQYANQIGYNEVVANGSNTWVNDTTVSNQRWLKLADGVTNSTVAGVLNRFYAYNPSDRNCSI
ncbi:nucleoside hydrolase [Annulohypoxylon maeteangense]|uniref:nucleoside hydrolase n=1 Tax=Annulohypoxylon maeteangense TaxID=1927788 RepID=UPI002008A365|nr:nucleoside hydrolase [Annulohypoxylon maeteangense]KAI0882123.1 nucleoside hydrolase [Annulohypoxylon maeteangense]